MAGVAQLGGRPTVVVPETGRLRRTPIDMPVEDRLRILSKSDFKVSRRIGARSMVD